MGYSPRKARANDLIATLIFFSITALPTGHRILAAEGGATWQDQWEKAVRAAEQEGQLVLYSLSEVGDAIARAEPAYQAALAAARHGSVTVIDAAALVVSAR